MFWIIFVAIFIDRKMIFLLFFFRFNIIVFQFKKKNRRYSRYTMNPGSPPPKNEERYQRKLLRLKGK